MNAENQKEFEKVHRRTKVKKLRCWEIYGCENKECPAYKSRNFRCWLTSETNSLKEDHGKLLCKTETCLGCKVYKANVDAAVRKEVDKIVNKVLRKFREDIEDKDREMEKIGMELAISLSEVFEALRKIASGDPTVRIPETSDIELIGKLKHMVNLTAEEIGEIVDQSHDIAIDIAEHFDVLHRVSRGEMDARISGSSNVELMGALKTVTNEMIESISREIAERKQNQEALQKAREELEQRVRERTAELTISNERLTEEIESHKLAEQEIQKLNRDLHQKVEELTEANRELDAFNYSVSHDLKTPLLVVEGYIGRLQKIYGDTFDEKAADMLHIIRTNAQKMERLIRDLLAFSRSGRQQITATDIDIAGLVKSAIEEIKPLSGGRTIHFDVQALPPAYGDKALIKQVLVNLLSNAVKFSASKDVAVIEVGGRDADIENIYYVKDNGVGFDPLDSDKVFSAFHRLPGSREIEGSGVGLSIVERIIGRHGGRAWAEGHMNEGAVFYFSLPKHRAPKLILPA
jgi:signal transduction histidine kinase